MSDLELYASYFPVGKKVGVGIPMPNATVFNDWAVIHSLDEDLVMLQLSRDVLPIGVSLRYGQIIELRGFNDGGGYCCRAIIVSEGEAKEFLLRLIGEVVSNELREFYRVDAFLPIKYFVSNEQNIDRLRTTWEARRNFRMQRELEQKEIYWPGAVSPVDGKIPVRRRSDSIETRSIEGDGGVAITDENNWDSIIPLAANISGGGLRITVHHLFEQGEYVILEIMVPAPRRIVDVVGRVVFSNRNRAAGTDHEYYNIGIQFVFINERDRDAIATYISSIQLKRIKQMRESYLFREGHEDYDSDMLEPTGGMFRNKIIVILTILIVVAVTLYFRSYINDHPKGQIQRLFEEGLQKYRERQLENK